MWIALGWSVYVSVSPQCILLASLPYTNEDGELLCLKIRESGGGGGG